MRLEQALGSGQVQGLIDGLAREAVDRAFGLDIQESAMSLPPRPGDGSLVDALLSEPVLGRIRKEAAEQARAAVARAKGAKRAEICREMHAERIRQKTTRGRSPMRLTRAAHQFMEGRQDQIDTAPLPQPRTSLQILEALMPGRGQAEPVLEPEPADNEPEVQVERVRDPYTGASVAAVPPAARGWREQLALRGCGETTIRALGGAR
jgi:hypothetical protein